MCIQYCKGLDIQTQYAVLGQNDCSCVEEIPDFKNQILDSSNCGFSSSLSLIGNDTNQGLTRHNLYTTFYTIIITYTLSV